MEKLMQELVKCGYNSESIKGDLSENHQMTINYALFVSKMAAEIGALLETEERLKPPESSEMANLSSWKMEVSSFLKELHCPLTFLYEGELHKRLDSKSHRLLLLDFLLSELLSARIEKLDKSPSLETGSVDSSTTSQLSESLKTLNLSSPPAGVSPAQFFKQLLSVIENVNPSLREVLIGQPLFTGTLSDEQWQILQQTAMDLESEYAMRRTMLITRLRATVKSFTWSDKTRKMSKSVADSTEMKEFRTSAFTNVSVADVLAARKDLTIIRKVSSVPPATRGLVKADNYGQLTKVKIGKVPDRGGRPSEQAPPPPEMPSWQQRSGPQHGQQRGGGQGGLHFFGGGQGGSGGRGGGYQQGGNRGGYNQPGGHPNQDSSAHQRGGYQRDNNQAGPQTNSRGGGTRGVSGISDSRSGYKRDFIVQENISGAYQALLTGGLGQFQSTDYSQRSGYQGERGSNRDQYGKTQGRGQGEYHDRSKGVQGAGWKRR